MIERMIFHRILMKAMQAIYNNQLFMKI